MGLPLLERLGLDPADKADRRKVAGILKAWFGNGVLATATGKDYARHEREYVVPGTWNEDDDRDSQHE